MSIGLLFDAVLAISLLWTSFHIVTASNHFSAIISFIGFGLLLTLAWARLQAPDIALAEAAIGSGISGVLLLEAYASLKTQANSTSQSGYRHKLTPLLVIIPVAAASLMLMATFPSLPPAATVLADTVQAHLSQTGVSHPVTAVLLNYRGYDTLLEVMVVLLALITTISLQPQQAASQMRPSNTLALGTAVTPLLIVLAVYLLWAGAFQPGGAFQAAAVFAGAILLLQFSTERSWLSAFHQGQRLALASGLLLFVIVAASTAAATPLLTLPPKFASGLILAIESLLTLSLGLMLAGFFITLTALTEARKNEP